MTAGLQVNLSVGINTVKVKVTAPDTTTTQTYTVAVVRVAVPVACSAASMVNRIWTGNLTVGGGNSIFGFAASLGVLDDTMFVFQGTTYTVKSLQTTFGTLSFTLDSSFANAADVVLHVGDDQYPLDDATPQPATHTYIWATTPGPT